jgi:hypothetical protein
MFAHPVFQALAGDVLHAKPRHAFGFSPTDDADDSRMVQPDGSLRFAVESFALIWVGEAGSIDHAHAATADFLREEAAELQENDGFVSRREDSL